MDYLRMNLGVSIANLLRRYPAVDVPGIGVFKRTHTPASYDAGQSVLIPPTDRIELVERHSDVFPITAYMQAQQQVDGPTATALLETAVNGIMDSISRNGEALLEGLGYLFADGASFVFKPFEANRLTAKPVVAPLPISGDAIKQAVEEEDGSPKGKPEIGLTGEEYTDRRNYTPWLVSVAVAALMIAVAAIWYYQPIWFSDESLVSVFKPKASMHRPEPVDESIPFAEVERDSVVADSGRPATTVPDFASVGLDSASETDTAPAKPSVTYEIIVGSFATMHQANKFVAEMKAKGYDLHAIDSRMPGNRKKISWGSFATEEEAYKELARVQKTLEPTAWIAKVIQD